MASTPTCTAPPLASTCCSTPSTGPSLAAVIDEASFRGSIEVTWGQRRPPGRPELHDMWCSMAHDNGMAQAHELLQYVADRREHE